MTNEEKIEELASVIYSQCGVEIRNVDSYTIAKKLIELGYEKSENGKPLKITY